MKRHLHAVWRSNASAYAHAHEHKQAAEIYFVHMKKSACACECAYACACACACEWHVSVHVRVRVCLLCDLMHTPTHTAHAYPQHRAIPETDFCVTSKHSARAGHPQVSTRQFVDR